MMTLPTCAPYSALRTSCRSCPLPMCAPSYRSMARGTMTSLPTMTRTFPACYGWRVGISSTMRDAMTNNQKTLLILKLEQLKRDANTRADEYARIKGEYADYYLGQAYAYQRAIELITTIGGNTYHQRA